MSRPRILVIDNYDSFTWNLVHFLEEAGATTEVHRNDKITVGEALEKQIDAVVMSPGPCTPNEAGICLELAARAPDDLPILGVCLGHQAIGQALGGTVSHAKAIKHGKRSTIHHTRGPLFAGLPERFDVVRYHSLAVLESSLPEVLIADAFTDDGEIMAMRHKERPVYGVQFHPESILTEHGMALLRNFVEIVTRRG